MVAPDTLPRARTLWTCIALAFELASPLAMATVTSCDDSASAATTPGTLRYEVENAASGATVDFNLPPSCNSSITLETGALTITQNALSLQGPSNGYLNLSNDITGAYNGGTPIYDRVIKHDGTATLTLSHLAISQGEYTTSGSSITHTNGGCIYSSGSVTLSHASITGCTLVTLPEANRGDPIHYASGGGLFVKGSLRAYYSTISGNTSRVLAISGKYPQASCGGAYVGGSSSEILGTTISDNKVTTSIGNGGGLCLTQGGLVFLSTISGNSVAPATGTTYATTLTKGGGVYAPGASGAALGIVTSTVSGNSAGTVSGGVFAAQETAVLASTITFNSAGAGAYSDIIAGTGLALLGAYTDSITSSLIIYNTVTYNSHTYQGDLTLGLGLGQTTTVQGSNNLVGFASFAGQPGFMITESCPRLGPLRDNGGPTKTHALLSFSAALEEGVLADFGLGNVTTDQRLLPRTAELFPDVGAYEVQRDDIIFNTNFEGCVYQ